MTKLKIRRGDKVIVTTGKDKGKGGEVLKVMPKENRIVVAGVNVVKKHTKQSRESDGGIISKELSIHISNVAHADPATGKPTKVGRKTLEDGKKVRFAKKSGEIIVNAEGK